jgi:hypothetical protein
MVDLFVLEHTPELSIGVLRHKYLPAFFKVLLLSTGNIQYYSFLPSE